MRHRMTKWYKSFCESEEGSMAAMAAIGMLLMIAIIGITIDTSRLVQTSSKLKALNDMASIAATQDPNMTLEQRKEIFEGIMQFGIENNDEFVGYEYDLIVEDTVLTTVLKATTTSQSRLFFPAVTGGVQNVSAHTEVIIGKQYVEVALVLDISSSMNGARITEMKKAASTFVNILLEDENVSDRVAISIIPYGGTVRLPSDMQDMLIEPLTTDHWFDGEWNGCVDINTKYIDGALSRDDTFEYLPSFYVWNKNNPWCPREGNELIGLSNDRDALLEKIENFELSDGTGTDIGVAWGFATLDPDWRGKITGVDSRLPRNYAENTKKFMIVMTDGGITAQYYPRDDQFVGDLPYFTKNRNDSFNDSLSGFNNFCDLAKQNNIDVYTVGFLLTKQNHIDRLNACGTTAGHNLSADLGGLETVFENLASALVSLRLTQ